MGPAADRLTLGSDLVVNRFRYGAMQLTGRGVWGEYPDRDSAIVLLRHGVNSGIIALAWLLHRSPVMLPIPGTSSREHFDANLAAAAVQLTPDEVRTITNLVPDEAADARG